MINLSTYYQKIFFNFMNLNLKGYDLLNSQSKRQCYIDWLNNSRNNMDLSNFNSMFPEFETIMSE